MAEQQPPLDPKTAPDPARSYERSDPRNEPGMGRLDNNTNATPTRQPDKQNQAIRNDQPPRQINAHEVVDDRAAGNPGHPSPGVAVPPQAQPDHSMMEEEPLGEDQAPTDIHDPDQKRHPRKEGRGGTP